MNQYGAQALKHWQEYLPTRYATLNDPNSFFSTLGEQAAQQIDERTQQLAGPDQPDEGYLDKLGRLNEARMRATEEILRELIWLDPETDSDPDNATIPTPTDEWVPLVENPTHPAWQIIAEQEAAMTDDEEPDPPR